MKAVFTQGYYFICKQLKLQQLKHWLGCNEALAKWSRLFRKTDGTIKTLVLEVEFKVLRLPINQETFKECEAV